MYNILFQNGQLGDQTLGTSLEVLYLKLTSEILFQNQLGGLIDGCYRRASLEATPHHCEEVGIIIKIIKIIKTIIYNGIKNVKYIKSSIDKKYDHKNYNIQISTQNAAILSFLIEENDQKSKCQIEIQHLMLLNYCFAHHCGYKYS